MTQTEWNSCTDPHAMLEFLRAKVSDRKLRLFAVACCRRIWHDIPGDVHRQALEVAEKHADGEAGVNEHSIARQAAKGVLPTHSQESAKGYSVSAITWATVDCAWTAAAEGAHFAGEAWIRANRNKLGIREKRTQLQTLNCILLRSIFTPFRAINLDRTWLTPTVKQMAQSIYKERAFDRMPILADALEEAGCTNTDILNHCRSGGEHVRGCWVIDLLLGKE